MVKVKLVENWREWPKMASQWCNAAGIAGCVTYAAMPEKLQDALQPVAPYIAGAIFIAGVVARLVKQKSVSGDANTAPEDVK